MTKNNPIMTKRYDLLDAYRLFASIGVITIHCRHQLVQFQWFQVIQFLLAMCVSFFFMISGYFLTNKMNKIQKQLHKLLGIYLYTLVLYIFIDYIRYGINYFNFFSLKDILYILFMNQTPWNGVLWFIPASIMLLICDKYIFSKISNIHNRIIFIVSLTLSLTLITYKYKGEIDISITNFYIQGIPFYLLGRQLSLLETKSLRKIAIFSSMTAICIIIFSLIKNSFYDNRFIIGTIALTIIFISGLLYKKDNTIISIIGVLGRKYSLGIYIYHIISIWLTPGILKRVGHEEIFQNMPVISVFITSLILTFLINKISETILSKYTNK